MYHEYYLLCGTQNYNHKKIFAGIKPSPVIFKLTVMVN